MQIKINTESTGHSSAQGALDALSKFLNQHVLADGGAVNLKIPAPKKDGMYKLSFSIEINERPYEDFRGNKL